MPNANKMHPTFEFELQCLFTTTIIITLHHEYIYIYIYVMPSISFQTYFVLAFKIVVDTWKLSMLLLYMRWLTNFYDFRFKSTAISAIGIHPTFWFSQLVNFKNAIWTWGHSEERCVIKFCFKLGNNATETYGMPQTAFGASCMNRASVFEWHKRFNEGRESVRDDERCGRSKEVNTPELIGQRVRIRVTMLRF